MSNELKATSLKGFTHCSLLVTHCFYHHYHQPTR